MCLLKVKAIMWLLWKGALLTWPNLERRGWNGQGLCVLCGSDSEVIPHLFLSCTFSREIWRKSTALTEIHLDMTANYDIGQRGQVQGNNTGTRPKFVAVVCWNI